LNPNILTAIVINITILLLASWIFGGIFIRNLTREKDDLFNKLNKLRKLKQPPTTLSPPSAEPIEAEVTDYSALIDEMARDIQEKEERINTLLALKNQQQDAQQLLKDADTDDNTAAYLEQLEAGFKEMEKIIMSLEYDLNKSRITLKDMKAEMNNGQSHSARVFTLEKSERRLRDENKTLRGNGIKIAEKLNLRNTQVNNLKDDNNKLKKSIASLSNASKEQLEVIRKLHAQIERAEKLEVYQRQLIIDLESRLATEKDDGNDSVKVGEMEVELENLRDTLKRTLIEKEFIEEHMLELDDTLEKAKATEAALTRSQQEMESLEQHYPEYTPTITPSPEEQNLLVAQPLFTTDMPELSNIMENNRLFGSILEFWTTLDIPPLNLIGTQRIPRPTINEWVYLTIGNGDYSVLMTIDEKLADVVTQAIFKSGNGTDQDKKDTRGELGNIIAGTLATELDNNFVISVPKHIDQAEANKLLTDSTLVSEILATAQDKPLYAALIIPTPPVNSV
jgi:hypothetical protein